MRTLLAVAVAAAALVIVPPFINVSGSVHLGGQALADIPAPPPPKPKPPEPPAPTPAPAPKAKITVQDNEQGRLHLRFKSPAETYVDHSDSRCPYVVYARSSDVGVLPCELYAHLDPRPRLERHAVRIVNGMIVTGGNLVHAARTSRRSRTH